MFFWADKYTDSDKSWSIDVERLMLEVGRWKSEIFLYRPFLISRNIQHRTSNS